MNTPATPTARAARASTGTNSRSPPRIALPARLLHRMRRVENDRRAGLFRQNRQRAHIGDESVVAKRYAALGDEHVAVSCAGDFFHHVGHVPRREELTFLDIDDASSLCSSNEQVSLAAQEGWDLQDVDDAGDRSALIWLVHVGEQRDRQFFPQLGEDRKRVVSPIPRALFALVRFALSKEVL